MSQPAVVVVALVALIVGVCIGAGVSIAFARQRSVVPGADIAQALQAALSALQVQAGQERDTAVNAAMQQMAIVGRQQLGAESASATADLAVKKDIIDARLGQIQVEVRGDLDRLVNLVGQLGESTSQRFGQVDQSLRVRRMGRIPSPAREISRNRSGLRPRIYGAQTVQVGPNYRISLVAGPFFAWNRD